ncbi:hypothetical protein L207DRAFT_437301 [Hyaloscypha variabilis F]|uniref:Uncharacterized protein n=1 Tax=Hyaloscypha variabilis (strain UAMH 11265 / GT02V1 / F) TaxID=1149755 RepID=A0A2J6R795_HYAVF|nr:hypothetical protein L207DRAFT_437301 [Hyaloscypha variabilis F]
MFDVSWVDPTRETVGQRKNRKEQSGTRSISRSSIHSSGSTSTDSPSTKSKPSLLNLFGSVKTPTLNRTGSQPKLSSLRAQDAIKASRRISSYTVSSDTSTQEFSDPTSNSTRFPVNGFFNGPYLSDDQSTPSEVSESVFSGRTGRSRNTQSTWSSVESTSSGRFVQPLSPKSFVTQNTEVTISPSNSMKAVEQVAKVVRISSAGTIPIQIHETPAKSLPPPTTFDFPVPTINLPRRSSSITSRDSQSTSFTVTSRGRKDSWKPPEIWECPEDEDMLPKVTIPKLLEPPLRQVREKRRDPSRQRAAPVELQLLRRNIRRMEAASPKIILERLKEEWVEVADASVYRELELEKQLWMLSALRGLKQKSATIPELETVVPSSGITKILSLYENQASCSILSALTTAKEVHHLSPTPLSPKSYPNIQPLAVPGPTSQLPYASNIFTSIQAFCLPALLPAASLPLILKECHRTLISAPSPASPTEPAPFSSSTTLVPHKPDIKAGTLHLTILDPSPLPSTLGPRLRAWLDTHLILNLERQFRCINPSRLFPIWLADAGLRGEGSTIVNVRFFASVGMETVGGEEEAERTRQELKSVVGRMLWREMWGGYVVGEKWWWDDESVVEECERMGTFWEYAVIEGVKEG